MLRIDSPQEDFLIDPFDFLGSKRKDLLESGWPALFRIYLMNKIPVDEIKRRFSVQMGRPTKELRTVLAVLLLQQMFDLTDHETCRQLSFNIEWHYALNLHLEDDNSKYICERTLRSYRILVTELEIDTLLFQLLTDTLLDKLNLSPKKQRLDSTHIHSDMRRLSRIELFRKTIEKFMRVMNRKHPRLLKKRLDGELIERYLEKKNGYFAWVQPSEAKIVLQQVAEDLLVLVETFRSHRTISGLEEFGLLQRVLNEQCDVTGEGEDTKVDVKEPQKVSSDSLQNPSDPDAGYSGHKGEGYQVQLMETYQDEKPAADEKAPPNLITYVDVEPANCSDTDAPPKAIKETKKRGCAPDDLLADSLYGSDDNVQKAAKEEVNLIAPTMGKPKTKEECLILDDFIVDEDTGEITVCPDGEEPIEIRRGKDDKLTIYFDPTACESCQYSDYCCVDLKDGHKVDYTPKQLRLAKRRAAEDSDEFREKYRWRSGIEAVNAKLKRKFGMGRLRVRGLGRVRFAVTLKVLGWNIFQAARA
jgi:hypothetical protein